MYGYHKNQQINIHDHFVDVTDLPAEVKSAHLVLR